MPADCFQNDQFRQGKSLFSHRFRQSGVQMIRRLNAKMQLRDKGVRRGIITAQGRIALHSGEAQTKIRERNSWFRQRGKYLRQFLFRLFNGKKRPSRRRNAVGETGEQAGARLLVRLIQSAVRRQGMDILFAQTCFGEKRAYAKFRKGKQAGAVAFPIRGVCAIAQNMLAAVP